MNNLLLKNYFATLRMSVKVSLMITVSYTHAILYHSPSRLCNYLLKHYEIDTQKSPKFDILNKCVDFKMDLSPLNPNGFQQLRAENLSWSVFYRNKRTFVYRTTAFSSVVSETFELFFGTPGCINFFAVHITKFISLS